MQNAKRNKYDEFYTKYETVATELEHYKKFLKGKKIYCNCDDPNKSNFWKYFKENFENFELASLTSTFYGENARKTVLKIKDGKLRQRSYKLKGNGDYRSPECIRLLSKSDVVITNPPFSLTKEFIPLMYEHKKDFIILGNQNILTFRDVYPHILDQTLRLGISIHSGDIEFEIPKEYDLLGNAKMEDGKRYARVTGIRWFTSFEHNHYSDQMKLHSKRWNLKNNKILKDTLIRKYNVKSYPTYDNYPAIEVPYTSAIPSDYKGVMGVPITFLDKYDPSRFDLVGFRKGLDGKDLQIKGKNPYFRLLIKIKRKDTA